MVKAEWLEAQFGGVYTAAAAQGELESRTGKMTEMTMLSVIPAFPGHPQSSGFNERTGHLHTTQLHHAETQDRLSWCVD
jgi:hypothetical protein